MKVVLFGDSLFAQLSKRQVQELEAAIPGSDVYNCAVGGWDSNGCVAKGPYIAQLKPDVLIISLGTNDASSWKPVELEKFKENVNKVIDIFEGSKFIYFLPPPSDESKHSPDKVRKNETTKQYHDAAKKICEEKGALTIDSWNIFKPMLDKGETYHVEDGTHLEDNAYDIIIAEIAKLLNDRDINRLAP
jgi:lysophospholipase L1-like esterase